MNTRTIARADVTRAAGGGDAALAPVADAMLTSTHRGRIAARCACWWRHTPSAGGRRTGVIGSYSARGADAGRDVLDAASATLAEAGCDIAIGPMDGNTWNAYRLVLDRGPEPPFLFEPESADDWPLHWQRAGFDVMTTYSSALVTTLDGCLSRAAGRAAASLAAGGVVSRPLDPDHLEDELRRLFTLVHAAFAGTFLFTSIDEASFVSRYRRLMPYVHPALVQVAEVDDRPVGFLFGVPDVRRGDRGDRGTVILKTLAVHPDFRGRGLGAVLVERVQQEARRLGFARAIHALMHDQNPSRRLSHRYGRTFRRYALMARTLSGG